MIEDGPTYRLNKCRVYSCKCGAQCYRPLSEHDTEFRPFPKPCDRCGADLQDSPFTINDMGLLFGQRP